MNNNYKGSQWRRWDLHIHTPETSRNDCYEGKTTEEKWDNFYKAISEYVGDGSDPLHDICAIGITDYNSIDTYKKVKSDNLWEVLLEPIIFNHSELN